MALSEGLPGGIDAGTEDSDERFAPHHRVRQRSDYLQCYRKGRRRHSPYFTLHFHANSLGHPRLGITASRKVGDSVVRHRLKRWSREIFRRFEERGRIAGLDLVVHLKPEARAAAWPSYEVELEKWLSSLAAGGGR